MPDAPKSPAGGSAIYFDGKSNQRRAVTLHFADRLEIRDGEAVLAAWAFADIRRADGPSGMLRLSALTAPALARLEVRDAAVAADLVSRCATWTRTRPAAAVLPRSSAGRSPPRFRSSRWYCSVSRSPPIDWRRWCRRPLNGGSARPPTVRSRRCSAPRSATMRPDEKAFVKLMTAIRESAGMDTSVQSSVLSSSVPNAFALPGGRVYMFNGLLAKAENADEIAGVLAHELGHHKHRDNMRGLIRDGGTAFLVGLLFGDITGSSALIFASTIAGHVVAFARGRAGCRRLLDRRHAQARPADQADGRTAGSCHRQGRQGPVHHLQPSDERGSAGADDPGKPAGEQATAADAGRMAIAEIDLRFRWQDLRQDLTARYSVHGRRGGPIATHGCQDAGGACESRPATAS